MKRYTYKNVSPYSMEAWYDVVEEGDGEYVLFTDAQADKHAALKELAAERDALKADADRYRWLRHGDNDDKVICNDTLGLTFLLRNEQLDAVIDQAIAASEQP